MGIGKWNRWGQLDFMRPKQISESQNRRINSFMRPKPNKKIENGRINEFMFPRPNKKIKNGRIKTYATETIPNY